MMLVDPPSQMVSFTAVMLTVGSTQISTSIGLNGHLLLSNLSVVYGVILYVTFCALLLLFISCCAIAVPSNWPSPVLPDSPVMSGLSVTVQVYLISTVVVLTVFGMILVTSPSHIVSLDAVIVTVGSIHISTVTGTPGHLLLPL